MEEVHFQYLSLDLQFMQPKEATAPICASVFLSAERRETPVQDLAQRDARY